MRSLFLAAALLAIGCSNPPPPAPGVSPSGPVTINGTEKLGWDQPAANAAELASIGYELYLDNNAGTTLTGVSCASAPTAAGFECKAPLPRMTPGTHTLGLASFYLTNPSALSQRAGPLTVTLNATFGADPGAARSRAQSKLPPTAEGTDWPAAAVPVASGLDRPADLAFTPDNRLLVAELSGRVRVIHDATLLGEPALSLLSGPDGDGSILSLAVHPQFDRTRFVYLVYTARARSGALVFTLARFREAGDTLGDEIVLLDNIVASTDPHAVLRFGPDGKLYAAFDDGGDLRQVDDLASFNGKVLRIDEDGTTPDDAPRKSPVFLAGLASPRGLAWHAPTRHLWTADAAYVDRVRWTSSPNALASVDDDLIVGSDAGVVRAKIDPHVPGRITSTDDILRGVPVRALAVRADGAVFFATTDAVGVLNP